MVAVEFHYSAMERKISLSFPMKLVIRLSFTFLHTL
jgi:hypothetical protein